MISTTITQIMKISGFNKYNVHRKEIVAYINVIFSHDYLPKTYNLCRFRQWFKKKFKGNTREKEHCFLYMKISK